MIPQAGQRASSRPDEAQEHSRDRRDEAEDLRPPVLRLAAIDVHSREVFVLGVSSGRTDLEAVGFLKKVFSLCASEPFFLVDKGPWYEKAFKRMGVRFQRMTHGLRNSIE